jgi:hypothetical protein
MQDRLVPAGELKRYAFTAGRSASFGLFTKTLAESRQWNGVLV